jgi:hypothetical protein
MSIIIMAASLVERVLLISILNVVMSAVEVATFAGVVESVATHSEPDTFLFFLVRFIIADYFAVSDLSVMWDVFQIDEESCIGARNVNNALEEASAFVSKSSHPKWFQLGIPHERRVFHLFPGDGMDEGVC